MSAAQVQYTAADVGMILGFTAKTIRAWCQRGVFPGAKKFPDNSPRSEWRIPPEDVAQIKRARAAKLPVTRDRLDQLMDAAMKKAA